MNRDILKLLLSKDLPKEIKALLIEDFKTGGHKYFLPLFAVYSSVFFKRKLKRMGAPPWAVYGLSAVYTQVARNASQKRSKRPAERTFEIKLPGFFDRGNLN